MIHGREARNSGGSRLVIEGTTVHPADTELAMRARELLSGGPMDAVSLVAQVCRMSGAPAVVAEHLALTLLAGRTEFVRLTDGRWSLRMSSGSGGSPMPAATDGAASRRVIGEPAARFGPVTQLDAFGGAPLGYPPLAPAPLAVTQLDSLDYVVVDVETTGSRSFGSDRITEIAIVHVRGGRIVEQFESLVNPERSIPPMVSALTNITWDMVRHAPRFGELCDRIVPMLEGRVFVAHTAEFDWRFVTSDVARATGQRLQGERLCTVRLARRLLPALRSRRLDALANYYGITIHGRHRAGGDARATAALLLRLLNELADQGCLTFEGMRELLGRRVRRGRRGRKRAMPRGMSREDSA
jgi:DNA polymerase-3 subunit epsilon